MSEKELPEQPTKILPFERKPPSDKPKSGCFHYRVWLVESTRLVECRDCGQQLDAYSYLERLHAAGRRLGSWFDEFNRINRVRREEMRRGREQRDSGSGRWYFERPHATAKRGREVWDRIVEMTGKSPPALSRSRKWVRSLERGGKIYSDAAVTEPIWRQYPVEHWIQTHRRPKLVKQDEHIPATTEPENDAK